MTDDEPGLSSIEVERLYRDVASGRLADQLEVAETHQQRIASLMTIGSIVLPLTAGVLTSDSVDSREKLGSSNLLDAGCHCIWRTGCVLLFRLSIEQVGYAAQDGSVGGGSHTRKN